MSLTKRAHGVLRTVVCGAAALLVWQGSNAAPDYAFPRYYAPSVSTGTPQQDGAPSNTAARWEPEFRFPGSFFPSFAISIAARDKGVIDNAEGYGHGSTALLGVKVMQAPAGATIRVQIEIPELGASGEIEAPPSQYAQPRSIIPRLSLNQTRLLAVIQPLTTEVIFRVSINGGDFEEQRRPVRVHAINDVPLRACRKESQKCSDYSPFMAAFVNEDHPAIDRILRAALDIPAIPVRRWVGTQGSPDEVLQQVWAIWYLLQRNKFTYSSITTVSDSRQDLFSQTVRPLSQSLRTQQANCIDGTVLFASILRKIGIEPIIVLVPGHAFLGFYTDAQGTKPAFLETTMLNDANNPFASRGPTNTGVALAKVLGSDIHMQRSWQGFMQAIAEGGDKYNRAAGSFGKQPGYMLVPVMKARQAGIMPLPL